MRRRVDSFLDFKRDFSSEASVAGVARTSFLGLLLFVPASTRWL
jgi:hypothetical protein